MKTLFADRTGGGPSAAYPATASQTPVPEIASRFRPQSAGASRRYLSRRDRRRGDELQGRCLRLYAHRPSTPSRSAPRAPSRMAARGCFQFDRKRQVRARDRPEHLRLHVRPAGAGRPRRTISWIVDQMTNYVMKFESRRRASRCLLGRKGRSGSRSRPWRAARNPSAADAPGAGGADRSLRSCRTGRRPGTAPGTSMCPTGWAMPAWPSSTRSGVFVKSWGAKGTEQWQFRHRPLDRRRCARQRLCRRRRQQTN